jgi:hypothetical protein
VPGPPEAVWPAVDRCTQSANSVANHGTRHGSGFIRAVVTRTIAVATPDTITVTATSTITYPETQS